MGDVQSVGEAATLDAVRGSRPGVAYLLVVHAGTSTLFPLPDSGIVTIGRAPEVDLVLDHASVSRKHARVFVERGEIRIADLGSHNGTRVNGDVLEDTRVLTTGDVVTVGDLILVVHAEIARALPPVILDEPSWRRRLAEEVTRALDFHRPLGVLAIAGARVDPQGALRPTDVIGRDDGHVYALLPEADAATAARLATQVARAIPDARIGVATCPDDATDPDNLVLAVRAAAKVAVAGTPATPAAAIERRMFDDRAVVLCHPSMVRVFDLLKRLAPSDLSTLIFGETGVGKENAAYAVHHHSPRRAAPFIAVNSATVETLVESSLFGHDKGAFTGATQARPGLFESAHGGTLFFDEIGELSLAVQAKLLRAIETKRIRRLGETPEREVDVRIVAATNRVLEHEVEAGRFREDLYYRFHARVHLPALRDRRCEIPVLFREFVATAAARAGVAVPTASPEVMQRLLAYSWPGNVRELKAVAERAVAVTDDDRIELDDLEAPVQAAAVAPAPADATTPMRRIDEEIVELERTRMVEALDRCGGVKTRAAALIGMPIRTFKHKAKQYGL
jgi:two-component system, NtrC family, response regulator AtoC